jgi:Mn2+/Fe2+ NRAMP family transporter
MNSRRWRLLGPGFVSGASDTDPTTVATIAVIGATTIYGLAWLVVLILPMLAAVQTIAASIGAVCRTSVQGAILRQFGIGWAAVALVAVVAVNLMTLTADVEAGSEALTLLSGVRYEFFVLPFVAIVGWLLVSKSYLRIERSLSFVPLVFVSYGASAVVARSDWGAFARGVLLPQFNFSSPYATGALALLGTTLTSYVYIWESIEVSERRPELSRLGPVKADAAVGMLAAGMSFLLVLVATGGTLGAHHLPIQTAADIAAALRPLAGPWAAALFGIGLLASAMLAVPILAATTAYVATQTLGWSGSLNLTFREAPAFYGVIFGSLAFAAGFSFAGLSPISLLYWASITGGLATPLTLFFAVRVASNPAIMGPHRIGPALAVAGWIATVLSGAACVAFFTSALLRGAR